MTSRIDRTLIRDLTTGRRWSIPRIGLDLALWAALVVAAEALGHPAAQFAAAVVIGAGPLHDLLVHGHEATHGLASRSRRLNAVVLWATHALLGLSGRAYRALHLDHHRDAHGPKDSEVAFYAPASHNPRGVDYLRIPLCSHWVVNTRPWRSGRTRVSAGAVVVDLLAAVALHAALMAWAGPRLWALYLVVPIFTGLSAATVLRALTEHHGALPGDPLHSTRATAAHPVLRLLWSNVDHHLEHHLAPRVPWHRLPELRRRLAPVYAEAGVSFDRGLLPTALRLLLHRDHFRPEAPARPDALAHALRVRWFRDILRVPAARRHLFSLYFHGEAYEQLHPLGVWIDKLDPRWGRKLRRQLDDENRHAELFAGLLAEDGHTPCPLEGPQDVGWYLLHHVVPDVCEAAGRPGRFTRMQTMRYLGFLHALETRSIGDLLALCEAALLEGDAAVADVVTSILRDERWHATWTWFALCRLARAPEEALAVYAPIRRAERAATHRVVKTLIAVFADLGAASTWLARLRWGAMAWAARLGLAVAPLPIFDPEGRVPDLTGLARRPRSESHPAR